jgi:hypothetical protein
LTRVSGGGNLIEGCPCSGPSAMRRLGRGLPPFSGGPAPQRACSSRCCTISRSRPCTTLWDPSQATADSPLGCLNYRQFEYGNVCDGQPPGRQPGPRTGCGPGSWDPDPHHRELLPDEFAAFFKALKPDPRQVYVAVIAGPPAPVGVGVGQEHCAMLEGSCTGPLGEVAPAIRLASLVGRFDADRARFISLCDFDADPDAARAQLGGDLRALLAP